MGGEGDHLVVVTGGPGSGKTTLIDHLAELGHARTPEAGRALIRDQREIGGTGLAKKSWSRRLSVEGGSPSPPRSARGRWWETGGKDDVLFAELLLAWEIRSYREALAWAGPVLCDRGIPDLVGYHRLRGRPVPEHVAEAARRFRYHRRVFVAPPWPEIYTGDAERHQSAREAERTHRAMVEAYPDYGYEVVELPRAPVAERARFLLDALEGSSV